MAENAPHIRIRKLHRAFSEGQVRRTVLSDLNLDIDRGATVSIRGRSGTGKSTLLNLISGIDAPDDGSIEIAGQQITKLTERERTLFRRRHMGFVYQSFNLIPTLSVIDNVRLVLDLNGYRRIDATGRAVDVLEQVGLGDRLTSFPDVLSGGEQQRVAIARAIAHEPQLILADEPTGNLDDESAVRVIELLQGLVHDGDRTLLIATHSQRVAAIADRELTLSELGAEIR